MKGRILVIRGGAIGDFILTLPAIAALRRRFPEAGLDILGYPHIVQLARAGGLVDRVHPIESRALAGFFAARGQLAPELMDFFSEFDLIISYLYDPDGVFQENVRRCSLAQFLAGPHRPEEACGQPAATVFLKPLERLAIFDPDPVPRLALDSGWPAGTADLALHPGSGSESKNWPESSWQLLLEQLVTSSSLSLLLVGGEAEGERLHRLASPLPSDRVRVAQSWPLPDLGRALIGCRAFIGHDSGISHLAAALGLPCLVLWGRTAEAVWRPSGEQVRVLRHPPGLAHLEVREVLAAAQNVLCRP